MNKHQTIINSANQVFELEGQAILNLKSYINDDFVKVVDLIYNSKGRVIITGIGKSAIIGNKIVATLNSTGTPAIFMHAAEAIHGDLGLILKDDVVICISKSGNTPEIKVLIPLIKSAQNTLIAITGNADSFLGQHCDFFLNTYVEKEACPLNLAPTTSTTAQLAMGDALAVCLLEVRGFSSRDFAKYHPGGALGKKLYLRVLDISSQNNKPEVHPDTNIKEVIMNISKNMLGVTAVIENQKIVGIITDGDLRRMLTKTDNFISLTAKDIMGVAPKVINEHAMAIKALELMETNDISQLLVCDDNDSYAGVVHIHDLIKEGII
ncbi:KpsF/GutQ family sugar-phosphate isomerase [Formosa algae]|uniref:Arabinose-5-phosphate isomerase n=1 Tax=Formosa algae TaxID=225843 RepID=A0A9X0YJJ9_9FLAO|nr:KpsF/GutQ family sugar-phosphate isomerase [Formosa algae]MBP1839770.1 arabinose-5-phosphate isomerase [Formosa algae]MDQ0335369.1 arabinose-5-phosphate isomerase [Formosa algae]OEI79238.1 D-arabinose 5-phosphate isomerase [Formosa algae]